MIGPQVGPPHATMLVYLFTDIGVCAEELRAILQTAVEPSFNSISIDGDTSTNDTVLLLASGASGVTMEEARTEFKAALDAVCQSLAYQIVDDGEGVTHIVTLHITGARSEAEARQVARTIANSPLCKTAWSSGDPNWGRILAAAGYSGVSFDPAQGEHPHRPISGIRTRHAFGAVRRGRHPSAHAGARVHHPLRSRPGHGRLPLHHLRPDCGICQHQRRLLDLNPHITTPSQPCARKFMAKPAILVEDHELRRCRKRDCRVA